MVLHVKKHIFHDSRPPTNDFSELFMKANFTHFRAYVMKGTVANTSGKREKKNAFLMRLSLLHIKISRDGESYHQTLRVSGT